MASSQEEPVARCGSPTATRIVRAVRDLPGPIYVHCHHGKHRSAAEGANTDVSLRPRRNSAPGRSSAVALAIATAFTLLSTVAFAQQTATHQIGLIDMAHVFKNYKKFEALREDLRLEIEQSDEKAKAMHAQMQSLEGKIKGLNGGSPEAIAHEKQLFKLKSEFDAFRQEAARQEAARQEAARQTAATQQPATPPAASELRAISTPAPRYPPEALRSGTSGEVQVEFTVGVDGSVTSARVVRANPPRVFDREAVAAVRRWRFEPVAAPVTTRRAIAFDPGN
jgi:TonB family protein